jgi:hypothetical protein
LYLNPAHIGSLPQLNEQWISEGTLWLDIISSHAKAGTIKIIISVSQLLNKSSPKRFNQPTTTQAAIQRV